LAVYNNEFLLGNACVNSENYRDHEIIENLLIRFHFKIGRRRTEMKHQQRMGSSESRSYWTCCWRV